MFHVIRLKSLVLCLIIFIASVLIIRFSLKDGTGEFIDANANSDFAAEFNASYEALSDSMTMDLKTKESGARVSQADIITYLACVYENDFSLYSEDDIEKFASEIKKGKSAQEICENFESYERYLSVYKAALKGFIGDYSVPESQSVKYGLMAYCPIGAKSNYSHTDDFKNHSCVQNAPGNDIFPAEKAAIVAVEGGVISQCGLKDGVFSVTICSADKQRYYFYSNFDSSSFYSKGLKEGSQINAGSILGYFDSNSSKSGSSQKEPFHFGIKIIPENSGLNPDEAIWINPYNIVRFLSSNRANEAL